MATTTQIQNDIIEVYIAAFNRAPDKVGLDYWVAKVTDDNWSVEDVSKSFFDSSEVAKIYPSALSNKDFLNIVYNNVLGRDGDSAGITYWLGQMDNGITRDQMITTIINGAKADTGSANDKLLLENKTDVGHYFAVTLGLDDLDLAKESLKNITALLSSVDTNKDMLDIYTDSQDSAISLILGDNKDNTLTGTTTTDYIYGLDGNDVIMAGDGDNTVVGGKGIDTIHTGSGNDTIKGRLDDDTVYSGDGDDVVYGNEGNDSLHVEAGSDTVYGGDGDDYIYGNSGVDYIHGGDGNDFLYGGADGDFIYGEDGNDLINAGEGKNFVDGGNGDDIIYGGSSEDTIYGGIGNDTIYGLDGVDILDGLTGNDVIYAGNGADFLNGNEGDDILYGSLGDDSLDGESGADILNGGVGADTLVGGEGNDTFVFAVGDSNLATLDQIVDFSFSTTGADKLSLVNQGSEVISSSATDVSSATTLSEATNLAASGDGSTNAIIKWFIYEDNTYVVQDLSVDATFQNTTDIIIELQGVSNLQGLNSSTIIFS